MALGYIYVLSNPTMAGLLKIGYTCVSVERRAKELSVSTGVPVGFVVEYFHISEDVEEIETLVHAALGQLRVNENREFFRASVGEAVAAIERFIRQPTVSFIRNENKVNCRRCGYLYVKTPAQKFCPECGF